MGNSAASSDRHSITTRTAQAPAQSTQTGGSLVAGRPSSYSVVVTIDGEPAPGSEGREFEAIIEDVLSTINASRFTPEALTEVISAGYTPPLVGPGRLRPYVPAADLRTGSWEFADVLRRALNLLLFAHEVIIDDPSFWMGFELGVPISSQVDMDESARVVGSLVEVWDLVEDGSLLMGDMNIHPMWDPPVGRDESVSLGSTEAEFDHWGYQQMALEHWPGRTSPWFLSEQQSRWAENLLQGAGVNGTDRRVLQIPKLAALELPTLKLHTEDLVAVRRNSDTFGEWRQQLRRALSQVELLPDGDGWQRDAQAIIADELTPYAEKIRAETNRSGALSASVTGMKQLAIAGIGTAVGGLAGGSGGAALAGLGGVGLATIVSGMSDWVGARHKVVPNRAVLQLAMVFDDHA